PTEAVTEAPTEAVTEAPTEAVTEAPTEAVTEAPTEAVTEAPTEAVTEAPTEAVTEAPTEAVTEAPTEAVTEAPTEAVTEAPTEAVTEAPTEAVTEAPTEAVTEAPTEAVTEAPTEAVTEAPTEAVTEAPTEAVTEAPTEAVTEAPTEAVTEAPTEAVTEAPTEAVTEAPTEAVTEAPTEAVTEAPTEAVTEAPTEAVTEAPTEAVTEAPTEAVTEAPTEAVTEAPTEAPTEAVTEAPTEAPTEAVTEAPTEAPTEAVTEAPTEAPTEAVTEAPTEAPTGYSAKDSQASIIEGSVQAIIGNVFDNDELGEAPVLISFEYTNESGEAATADAGATVTTQRGGLLTVNGDGSWEYTPPANADHSESDVLSGEGFTYTAQAADGKDYSAVHEIDLLDTVPQAASDSDTVIAELNASTSGNVITGSGGSAGAQLAADDQGADGAQVTAVRFGNAEVNFDDDAAVKTDADGKRFIEIDGDNGRLTAYEDGSYTYNVTEPTVTQSVSGSNAAAWLAVELKAFTFGTAYTDADGKLQLTSANGQVSYTGNGIGVKGTQNGMPVGDQLNHDSKTGQSEALAVNFKQPVTQATVTLSNLYLNDNGGTSGDSERGKWEAFDAEGNLVGYGNLDNSTINFTNGHQGSAVIKLPQGGAFNSIVFTALGYENPALNPSDSSDYFIKGISYEAVKTVADVFTYVITDGDGDRSEASLFINLQAAQAAPVVPEVVENPNALPTASDDTVTTLEDVALTLSLSDFGDYDDADGDELAAIRIESLPVNGVLTFDGVAVAAGQEVAATEIASGKLLFSPLPDSDADGSFAFRVFDGADWSKQSYTTTIAVTAVADAPTVSLSIDEAVPVYGADAASFTALAFNGNNFSTGNLKSGNAELKFNSVNETAIITQYGVGIQNNANESSQGIDDNETLVVKLSAPATAATFALNTADAISQIQGNWSLFDANGEQVGTYTSFTLNGDGTVTVSAGENVPFQYVAFEGHSANGNASDPGYFVAPQSATIDGVGNTLSGELSVTAQSIPVTLSAALADTDGSESLSVVIQGVPEGATLDGATKNDDGTWTVTVAANAIDVSQTLTLHVPLGTEPFALTAVARAAEMDNGDVSEVTTDPVSIAIEVQSTAPEPEPVAPQEPAVIFSANNINDYNRTVSDTRVKFTESDKLIDSDGDGIASNGKVTAIYGAENTLELTGKWNDVKNAQAISEGPANITMKNFVYTEVTIDGGDNIITIIDAKRGVITTGDGNDKIKITALTNDAGWDNTFTVKSAGGNDSITISGDKGHTIAVVELVSGNNEVVLDKSFSSISVSAGSGNDTIDIAEATFKKATITTGEGNDTVIVGAAVLGADVVINGGAGEDTLVVQLKDGQLTDAMRTELAEFAEHAAKTPDQTFTFKTLGNMKVTSFEGISVTLDGQVVTFGEAEPPVLDIVNNGDHEGVTNPAVKIENVTAHTSGNGTGAGNYANSNGLNWNSIENHNSAKVNVDANGAYGVDHQGNDIADKIDSNEALLFHLSDSVRDFTAQIDGATAGSYWFIFDEDGNKQASGLVSDHVDSDGVFSISSESSFKYISFDGGHVVNGNGKVDAEFSVKPISVIQTSGTEEQSLSILDDSDFVLNLDKVTQYAEVNTENGQANTIKLNLADLLSDPERSGTIKIFGDASDSIELKEVDSAQWEKTEGTGENSAFTILSSENLSILIDKDISISGFDDISDAT
ncbi:hypothetical protein, partial [Chrysiogenes arsenatis]|uniref:hypothetical protein n=1 Tax=Chrysiogenes arsenatis TaxID=309797 RepID=UPI0004847606